MSGQCFKQSNVVLSDKVTETLLAILSENPFQHLLIDFIILSSKVIFLFFQVFDQ